MVEIASIKYTDEYSGSGATKSDYFMGSYVDKLTAYVTVNVHWETLQVQATFNAGTKTIKRQDNYSFIRDGFKVGDTFVLTTNGTNPNDGTLTIASLTDSTITTVEALTTGTYSFCDFNGTTQINALDFYYNLIENSASLSFISLTDNQSIQKVSVGKSNWVASETVTCVQATQSIGWRSGNVGQAEKITDADLASNYVQQFVITHNFYVTPFFLSGDLVYSEGKLIYPTYFVDSNSLKYVAKVDARYNQVDPSIPHTTDQSYDYPLGNIGWFDEFLNGGVADYTLTSVAYEDSLTTDAVDFVQVDRKTTVTAVLNSTAGNFTGVPQLVVNLFYCPQNESDYVSTKATTLLENFRFDHKLFVTGAAPVNGIEFGTEYQSLLDISAVINSANQVTVTFDVSFSQQTQTYLLARADTNRSIMITLTPQKEASTMLTDTDRNIVLVDFDTALYNQDDSTLVTWQNVEFFRPPDTTLNSFTDYKGFIGDHVLTRSKFQVSNQGTPIDLTIEIQAINSVTGEYFNLEKYTQQFPESEVNGLLCESNQPVILNYNLPPTDIRNQAYLYRNTALDTSSLFGWEFDYGFIMRYETWRNVPDFASAFVCDHTHDWSIYSLQADWELQYKITLRVESDDYITTFERGADITAYDDLTTADGFGGQITQLIETFYTGGSGFVDAKGLIFSDQDTHVKMTLTGDFSALPGSAIGYFGYLCLDIPNTGGEFTRDLVDSVSNPSESSVWMSPVFIEKVSDTEVTLECDIDYTKLDLPTEEYLLTGRFGFKY